MIEMNGFSVQLLRKRVKNLNLRIDRSGEVRLSAPLRFPIDLIHRFLHDKREWIEAHRRRLKARIETLPIKLDTGEVHYFLGKPHELIVRHDAEFNRVLIENEQLHLFIKPKATTAEKHAALHRWYRQEMKSRLPDLIKKWEAIIGVQVNDWGIKAMKTRWGSCNTIEKRIWLNLILIQKPLMCLEYVVVHELVHLLEASHNKRFHALMTQFMPDWKTWKWTLEKTV